MKRTFAMILALLLTLSLAACAEPSGGELREPAQVTTGDSTENKQTEEPAEEPTKEPEKTEAAISETELVDEAGVKITAKSLADVYNQRLIPFDTKKAVQTPKITAFESKNADRKPLFLFYEAMMSGCWIHQCTRQMGGGCICTQAK